MLQKPLHAILSPDRDAFTLMFVPSGIEHLPPEAWGQVEWPDGHWRVPVVPCDPPSGVDDLTHGWRDASLIAADGMSVIQAYVVEPLPPAVVMANEPALLARATQAVQDHLDATARTRGYDDMRSLVSYAEPDDPALPAAARAYAAEGLAAKAWRSAVWARCHELLAAVQAGARAPLTNAELLAELPAMDWPDPPAA